MKLSDYVAHYLHSIGIRHVFCVQGGAVAHLIDSVGEHPELEYICPAHEQAASFAVDGYYRVNQKMACAMATTGPGVMNLMTGIACLYYDSLPGIFIGGQVSTFRLSRNAPGVRQLGFQESPHVDLVKPITKYAVLIDDPSRIRYELEKATYLATHGRMGPVFLDICDDVQRAEIEPDMLPWFSVHDASRQIPSAGLARRGKYLPDVLAVAESLTAATRPIIVTGAPMRGAHRAWDDIRSLGVPVCPTWATTDKFDAAEELNAGCFGISGSRRGNFAIQNADLVISLGSRLDSHATGTPAATFARGAKKFAVDTSESERNKHPAGWITIKADAPAFITSVREALEGAALPDISDWHAQIQKWRDRYPSVTDEHRNQTGSVNPYAFIEALSDLAPADSIIIPDCGGNLIQTFQAWRVKVGQKLFSAFNCSPMGYSLSASIGACLANDRKPVICIIGDGGLQVNMQELATIARYNLPIKIFLLNNHGYGIIQQTQDDWLGGRYHGSRVETGLSEPDYVTVARACGILRSFLSVADPFDRRDIEHMLKTPTPILMELDISPDQRLDCFLKAGRPIEDANPLLPRDEFMENMIVEPMEVSRG